jgi:hypothetical protein
MATGGDMGDGIAADMKFGNVTNSNIMQKAARVGEWMRALTDWGATEE